MVNINQQVIFRSKNHGNRHAFYWPPWLHNLQWKRKSCPHKLTTELCTCISYLPVYTAEKPDNDPEWSSGAFSTSLPSPRPGTMLCQQQPGGQVSHGHPRPPIHVLGHPHILWGICKNVNFLQAVKYVHLNIIALLLRENIVHLFFLGFRVLTAHIVRSFEGLYFLTPLTPTGIHLSEVSSYLHLQEPAPHIDIYVI